jgi:hypothetical protein
MTRRLSARYVTVRRGMRSDTGAATAEYAVVSIAAAGLGGLLIKLLQSDWFISVLQSLLSKIVESALRFFGIGG